MRIREMEHLPAEKSRETVPAAHTPSHPDLVLQLISLSGCHLGQRRRTQARSSVTLSPTPMCSTSSLHTPKALEPFTDTQSRKPSSAGRVKQGARATDALLHLAANLRPGHAAPSSSILSPAFQQEPNSEACHLEWRRNATVSSSCLL